MTATIPGPVGGAAGAAPAVVVDGVSKRFRLYRERNQTLKSALMRGRRASFDEFWALRDVSFEIPQGSTFALVGVNGSGKSTLLKCIARILVPEHGRIDVHGKVAALLELGSGFHPELSGRENVYLNGSILGLSRREIDARFDDIVQFAGVEAFIDQPVKNYSSGMYVRLGFSVAINVDPDVLLVDEVLAVGDSAFQERSMEKFLEFRRAGKTIVVVSHGMETLRTLCDHAAWLEGGRLRAVGDARSIVETYVDDSHADLQSGVTGGDRWGSGEARLVAVDLVGSDGEARTRFETGEPVRIRLRYKTGERVERPVFGVALEASDGTYLWANNTIDSPLDLPAIDGEGEVECVIPRLMLQPGAYSVLASIVDPTGQHAYDFVRAAVRFDVPQVGRRESGGYLALEGSWREHR